MAKDGMNLVYFATDHLSSTSIVMNASGGLLSEQRYLPFGEIRTDVGATPFVEDYTDLGYTNQRNYGDFGLMDYNARFYSPLLGRFTQPDTIAPDSNPQHLNRYSYVLNSPLNFTDPNGHRYCDWDGDGCSEEGSGSGYGSDYDWRPDTWSYGGGGKGVDPSCGDPSGANCQLLNDSMMVNTVTAFTPGVETIDDVLTTVTGCGISCQLGYEDKVGWGWRAVSGLAIFLPVGNKMLKSGLNGVIDLSRFQGHHLIPNALQKGNHSLILLAQKAGFNIDDFMIYLPDNLELSSILEFPQHNGSHPAYNKYVNDILDSAFDLAKKQQWTPDDALRYLESLANDLAKMLTSGAGASQKLP